MMLFSNFYTLHKGKGVEMKKFYLVALVILMVAGLVFGGCAKPTPAPAPPAPPEEEEVVPPPPPPLPPAPPPKEEEVAPTPPPAWKWPEALTICTQQEASPMYAITVAWSSVLDKDTGTKTRITPEEIGALRLRRVGSGRYDMAVEENAGIRMTVEGISEHATGDGGPFPVRIFWPCFLASQTIVVRGDSDIKTMDDLKPGITAALHPGAGPRSTLLALMAWAGLEEEDVKILEVGALDAAMRAVVDGKADCCATDPGHPVCMELEGSPYGIRFLDLDAKKYPEAAARLLELQPTSDFGIPVLACKSAQGVRAIRMAMFYVVSKDTSAELTYHLAKWLDENFDAYKEMHPTIRCMSTEVFRDVLDTMILPVHEGTIKYLKEKGRWTEQDDKRQAYNVELVNKYVQAYKAAIADADKKGIKVDPYNEDWMSLWGEYKKNFPIFKVRAEIP